MKLHLVNTSRMQADECVSSLQPEAGSAVSDFCSDDKQGEPTMTYLSNLPHDIRMAWASFRYTRTHLRRGGCPDEAGF